MTSLRQFLFAFLVCLLAPLAAATAQSVATLEQRSSDVDQLLRANETLIERLASVRDDDSAMIELNRDLNDRLQVTLNEGIEITPRLTAIRSRLEQLGSPPAEGEPAEPELISNERIALLEERAQLNLLLDQLEQSSVRVRKAIDDISVARRDLFANTLSKRYDLRLAFGGQFIDDVAERWQLLERRVTSWLSFTWRFKQSGLLFVALAGAVLVGLRLTYGAQLLKRIIVRFSEDGAPSYFARLVSGFSFVVLPFLMTAIMLTLMFGLFRVSGILRPDIEAVLRALLISAGLLVFVARLAEALFSPNRAQWRMIPVSQGSAQALKIFLIAMGAVTVFDFLITQINAVIGNALTITIARSLFTSLATGGLLVAMAFQRPFDASEEADLLHGEAGRWAPWLKWLLVSIGAVLIFSALAGYIGFARFMAQQVVMTGAVMITMLIGFSSARAIAAEGALGDSRLGYWLAKNSGLSEARIDQLGLLAGLTLGVVVLLVGLPMIALFWGVDIITIRSWLAWFFTGITIGSITISLTGIAAGIAMFALGFWLTRRVQNVIDRNVLERGRVETGARTSIRTAIGYVGVALAALIGVSAAGIDLSQLAFVAGALSLGIGFGLQNIVNNFVSGLILLAERPFKSGDIIEAGGFTGIVKKVNVRATEMELFDQKTVILPNSELINSSVSNWMHRNTLGRIEVPVGVGYGADPQQVMDILLAIAKDHPRVLSNPEPFVAFLDFGASSLDFTLYAYLSDVSFGRDTRTDIRLEIVKRFAANDIEIPFPKRDVNVNITRGSSGSAGGLPAELFDDPSPGKAKGDD